MVGQVLRIDLNMVEGREGGFKVKRTFSRIGAVWDSVYSIQYTIYIIQRIQYSVYSIQNWGCMVLSIQYTVYYISYTIYSVHTVCTKFVLLNQPFGSRLHIHTTCTKVNVQKKEMVSFIFYIFNTGNLRWLPYFVKMWGSNNSNRYLGNAQMYCASTIMGLPLVW